MRIIADGLAMQSPNSSARGIGRYVAEQARGLARHHAGVIEGWYLRSALPMPVHVPDVMSSRLYLSDDPEPVPPDVYHATSPFEFLNGQPPDPTTLVWPRWARGSHTKLVSTVYDLIPFIYPDRYLADSRIRAAQRSRAAFIQCSDLVLAISRATADDAIRLLDIPPSRVEVVGTGVSESFTPPVDRSVTLRSVLAAVPGLRPGYIMYTGGVDFRKNILGLASAYAKLPDDLRFDHQLVIVCPLREDIRVPLLEHLRRLDIRDEVLLTDFVSDEVLLALYQAAHLFVFPSLYEGFGLPVVEALSCGTPVLVGDNSSLSELVDDPRARFDAADPEAIARSMFDTLTDATLRADLIRTEEHDWRWDLVTERTYAAYQRLRPRRNTLGRRPRIAVLTGSPRDPTDGPGTLDRWYALGTDADIDVFTDGDAGTVAQPLPPGVTRYDIRALPGVEGVLGSADRRVYLMGREPPSDQFAAVFARLGGDVVVDDVPDADTLQRASRVLVRSPALHAQVVKALPPGNGSRVLLLPDGPATAVVSAILGPSIPSSSPARR